MKLKNLKPLFIFEMANNHMGDVNHGIRIIRELKETIKGFDQFDFSIKLQHRDTSFIHPDHVNRTDHKLIKRFTETKLSYDDFKHLKDEIHDNGFITMCTPWDDPSVDLMDELNFDIIKIASCSFKDWPLLEKIAASSKPIIASTAGATLDDIDKVVSFFKHRNKDFALMHCVGEYPCKRDHLELNQISFFKKRYVDIPIGFSTHEDPENFDSIRIAIAQGAVMFEKHIGIPTEKYSINKYSAIPTQARKWIEVAKDTYDMCGVSNKRRSFSEKELYDLGILYRGVYAKDNLKKGQKISLKNVFLAMPNIEGQLISNNLSKYNEFILEKDIAKNLPIMLSDVTVRELRSEVTKITNDLVQIIKKSQVVLPSCVDIEISHHYGIENFYNTGAILAKIINRSYAKLLVIMFPGQVYPRHYHIQKDESYHILYGDLEIEINNEIHQLKKGDIISISQRQSHSFKTKGGVIIEEISTSYLNGDSKYEDETINSTIYRKTSLTIWPDLIK